MKIILFGASGNLGLAVAKELMLQGYEVTAVVRNNFKQNQLSALVNRVQIVDVFNSNELKNICDGYDAVISCLGKSVSPNDKSKTSFYEVDYMVNLTILTEAQRSKVEKFVYVSALHSEKYLNLNYFKVHHEFSERLISSGVNYSIIKPPALFSAFIDMLEMAKEGKLLTIGLGDKKTNPIYEGDLAKVVVNSLKESNKVIEAGGKTIYSRRQINELIQNVAAPNRQVRSVPLFIVKLLLPLLKFTNKNMFDKYAFYIEVMQHDTLAPLVGSFTLEEYLKMKKSNTHF